MLKISTFKDSHLGSLEIDHLVPLAFRAFPFPRAEPLLWRTGDLHRNLFEIKIDRDTGELFSATLISFSNGVSPSGFKADTDIKTFQGLPAVDVTSFSDRITDEPAPIILCQSEDQIWIFFQRIDTPTACCSLDRVSFLLRDDVLIGMRCSNLTRQELDIIVGKG